MLANPCFSMVFPIRERDRRRREKEVGLLGAGVTSLLFRGPRRFAPPRKQTLIHFQPAASPNGRSLDLLT